MRTICKRCHRIRVVNETGYCAGCVKELRTMERRRATPCPHCAANGIRATLRDVTTERGVVQRCWQCGGEYKDGKRVFPELCELCIDPIDKPHVDADGTRRWRACPNPATREVSGGNGRVYAICEQHFKERAS